MSTRSPADIGPGRAARWAILGIVGLLFAIPIVSMIEFTVRGGLAGGLTLQHWADLWQGLADGDRAYRTLSEGFANSMQLAVLTVVIVLGLLVPTMVLVRLSAPRLARWLELVCLLPITIPAIVLVVGLAPVYGAMAQVVGSTPLTLALAYGVLALPYAYRAIQSDMQLVDVETLAEASRSLGAGWLRTLWSAILPNIRRGVLTASIITVAIVLGEFTIASLLNRNVLQVALVRIKQTDAWASVIVSLLALAFAFTLLIVIARVGAGPRRKP